MNKRGAQLTEMSTFHLNSGVTFTEDTENKKIELNLDFEKIVPWNGQQDTGRDVRMKLDRNWQKVVDAFNFLLKGNQIIVF